MFTSKKFTWAFFCLILFSVQIFAQSRDIYQEVYQEPAKSCANYFAYPEPQKAQTPAPKGYKPFYISHYGRHGSRFLTSNQNYHRLIPIFHKADSLKVLTSLGIEIYHNLLKAYAHSKGKGGKLSELGARQHQGIAERMFNHYPEAFIDGSVVDAHSTTVNRCIKSMDFFCDKLKELNPNLKIQKASTRKESYFMACRSDSIPRLKNDGKLHNYAEHVIDSLRALVNVTPRLFTDVNFPQKNGISNKSLAHAIFDIYRDMPSLPELDTNFNIFTPEERWNYFRGYNINWFERCAVFPGMTPKWKKMGALVKNMVSWADEVIRDNKTGASLRFGHDTYVFPLAYMLKLEPCSKLVPLSDLVNSYNYIVSYDIVPMGANIQLIFFRKANSKDVLVKFLLQEEEQRIPLKTDCWPFYHWKDVRKYLLDVANS